MKTKQNFDPNIIYKARWWELNPFGNSNSIVYLYVLNLLLWLIMYVAITDEKFNSMLTGIIITIPILLIFTIISYLTFRKIKKTYRNLINNYKNISAEWLVAGSFKSPKYLFKKDDLKEVLDEIWEHENEYLPKIIEIYNPQKEKHLELKEKLIAKTKEDLKKDFKQTETYLKQKQAELEKL